MFDIISHPIPTILTSDPITELHFLSVEGVRKEEVRTPVPSKVVEAVILLCHLGNKNNTLYIYYYFIYYLRLFFHNIAWDLGLLAPPVKNVTISYIDNRQLYFTL